MKIEKQEEQWPERVAQFDETCDGCGELKEVCTCK